MRDHGRIPHEVDLSAARRRRATPSGRRPVFQRGRRRRRGGPFNPPAFELPEKDAPGVLGLIEHGLHGQDLPAPGLVHPAGDHHGHRDHPPLDPDLLVQGVDPEERILLGQGPGGKSATWASSSLLNFETWEAEMFSMPMPGPGARSSGRDPLMKASWTTAMSACSDLRLSEMKNGT